MYLNFNAYRLPILMSLHTRGGEATVDEVANDVFNDVGELLTYEDVTVVNSGEIAWRNRLRWVKHNLTSENYIEKGSKQGTWRITPNGRKILNKWAGVS